MSLITELAIVFFLAAFFAVLAKLSKQPIIIAYLISGVLIGYFGFFHLNDKEIFKLFSDLGIMFLLFLVGMEINYSSLKLVGKPALIVGLGQIVFTSLIGFLIALFFGFDYLQSAYIAIALTFSSTVIIIKLLSEKKDLNSLYGKISVGFLLVQDFVAILILIVLASLEFSKDLFVLDDIFFTILKGIILFFLSLWLGQKIFPPLFSKIRSQELLFLLSLAWLFTLSAIVEKLGFSIEIAGFLAGLALANSAEHFQVASRIRPLRDFFILIFFVILGSSLIFSHSSGIFLPIIILSLFVLLGNPLIVLIIMGLMGYRKRTSFLAGVTVAQISEFSLILAALGLKLGHLNENIVALITAVGVITITASTYLIINAEKIFAFLSPWLSIFERQKTKKEKIFLKPIKKPIILIGFHRTGQSLASYLKKEDLLIIEFDPEIIAQLRKEKFNYLFADISDLEIFNHLDLNETKLIISTAPHFQDNLALLNFLNKIKNRKFKIILRAEDQNELEIFYKKGADYVLYPYFTSGQYLSKFISLKPDLKFLAPLKKRDLELIKKLNRQINKI